MTLPEQGSDPTAHHENHEITTDAFGRFGSDPCSGMVVERVA